jgi:C-terminal processing protease CtpA/Prc
VNDYCASSTEQFLLAAKQSKKVKLFGRVTDGTLDFSNLNRIESPCGDFKLYYATSKVVDIENFPIDNIGIQPDYYLDDAIPEYQWIEYVKNILNNRLK